MKSLHAIVVVLGILIAQSHGVRLSDFYPYGVSNGDTVLPAGDDGDSGSISISTPFPYFNRNHNSLYVNINGAISFVTAVGQYTPAAFPLNDQRPMIAPFWGDVDTRNGGTISYRQTTDNLLLLRAYGDIQRQGCLHLAARSHLFFPTWIFIATWDRVAFYGASASGKSKVNTFQSVLITDGRESVVIFNYNVTAWTTGTASGGNADTGLGGTPAQSGFNAGDGTSFFDLPGSRTNQILNLPLTSNVGRCGKWMFQTHGANVVSGACSWGVQLAHNYCLY